MSITVGTDSYVSSDEATAYFGARLYSGVWTKAVAGDQEAALKQSTRMLDDFIDWIGMPTVQGQALRWPRRASSLLYAEGFDILPCVDYGIPFGSSIAEAQALFDGKLRDRDGNPIANDAIPQQLKNAVCEQAIYLLSLDPTQKPTLMFKGFSHASGSGMAVDVDKRMRPDMICVAALGCIAGLGTPKLNATASGAGCGSLGRG